MIFIALYVIKFSVFFILMTIISYFFITGKNIKKILFFSTLSIVTLIFSEILSIPLLYCFLYLSEFIYNVVH
ncbi:hypothetical protein Xkoz_00426 [Xenorhabdus kozodoii]|uniref:Uncharacterized protein n=1 Tax=Xenorhabdus kozodoii TaxID=351676 RepID=A0A2D0LGX9_9GAMM|nr:hypothetical protein Xkoz_00426 [Xenorhabdus kozodoii]